MNSEDDEFNRIERESKQRMEAEINKEFDEEYIKYRAAFPKDYRLPKPWVGLTEDEVFAISKTMPYADRFDFAAAIENKLKEKNEM